MLNLIDAGAGVLGQVEDVHLPMAQNNSHANRSMTQAVDGVVTLSLIYWNLPTAADLDA